MKRFNQIVFLSSFAIVGAISAMEMVEQDKSFICFKKNAVEVYGGSHFCYDSEYNVKRTQDDVLFPVASIDPLKIESCGHIKFFVTSNEGKYGKAFAITDPTIKQLAVVRGGGNNYRINAYIGFDTDYFKLRCDNHIDNLILSIKDLNKIYVARLINLQVTQKISTNKIFERNYNELKAVELLDARTIELALMIYLYPELKTYVYEGNWKWESPLFQEKVKEILGERAKDFNFDKKCFQFSESYWTAKENKLKGITYGSAHK